MFDLGPIAAVWSRFSFVVLLIRTAGERFGNSFPWHQVETEMIFRPASNC